MISRAPAFAFGVAVAAACIWSCGNGRSEHRLSAVEIPSTVRFPEGFLWGTVAPGELQSLVAGPTSTMIKKSNYIVMRPEDFAFAASISNNAYRFLIAWDKLYPREGMDEPDAAALAYYDDVFAALKRNHVSASVTLFDSTAPPWLLQQKNGKKGWERDDALAHFETFVRAVAQRWGTQVNLWCSLNEPMVYLQAGYIEGTHPPFERRNAVEDTISIFKALLRAHAVSYKIIHEMNPKAEVGMTVRASAYQAYRNRVPLDRISAGQVEQALIWDFLDAVHSGTLKVTNTKYSGAIPGLKGTMDFVGINYYARSYVLTDITSPNKFTVLTGDKQDASERMNEVGWAHYPKGLHDVMAKSYARYKQPIYVLENGTADSSSNDYLRQELLVTHLAEVGRALNEGIPVKGYFHRSLLDSFERADGLDARFGLVSVDTANGFKRTPRPSANVYAGIIRDGISPELYHKYAVLYGEK